MKDGCPDSLLVVRDDILFVAGSNGLEEQGLEVLDTLASMFLAHPTIQKLRVRVVTGEPGIQVAKDRAETVVEYLILSGIEESILVFEGAPSPEFGPSTRVEFHIDAIQIPERNVR